MMMYFPQTGSIIVSTNNQSVSVSMIEVNILIVWRFDRFLSTTCPYHPFILLRTSLNSNSITMRLFKRVHSDNRFYWTLLITRFAAPIFSSCVWWFFSTACVNDRSGKNKPIKNTSDLRQSLASELKQNLASDSRQIHVPLTTWLAYFIWILSNFLLLTRKSISVSFVFLSFAQTLHFIEVYFAFLYFWKKKC